MEQDYYRETICMNCPGSLWGERSICRIHQCSIGLVKECPQWSQTVNESKAVYESSGDPLTDRLLVVEEDLKSYSWMVREINRIRSVLTEIGTTGVSRYGIEAALPGKRNTPSDPVQREAINRRKQADRLEKLERKVKSLEFAAEQIEGDRMKTVLACMMEGERMNVIARHIGVSRQRLNEIKRELIKTLAGVYIMDKTDKMDNR